MKLIIGNLEMSDPFDTYEEHTGEIDKLMKELLIRPIKIYR